MATVSVPRLVKTIYETSEGRVDVVASAGYTFKVVHGKVERANRAEELHALDEAKNPVLKRLRNGVIRGSLEISSGERVSVYFEASDEDGSLVRASADEWGNVSVSMADLDLCLTYGQYLTLKRLFSGRTLGRLLDTAQDWCQAV